MTSRVFFCKAFGLLDHHNKRALMFVLHSLFMKKSSYLQEKLLKK